MIARIKSSAVTGIDGAIVAVEVDISFGLPAFTIVGLPETAVRESRERVKAAVKNSGYSFPMDRITVNLAPADIKKEGTGYDLPVALGILGASELFTLDSTMGFLAIGELSLDGRIKPVNGVLPAALAAKKEGFRGIIVPKGNQKEAGVVPGLAVYPVETLSQVVDFLSGHRNIDTVNLDLKKLIRESGKEDLLDFSQVQGQASAKRALEIAAAGSHNLLMSGPPGSGKTMLAKRLTTILPRLTFKEALQTTQIYSVVGLLDASEPLVTKRPFRSPHHTVSEAGLVGGGIKPVPGEVTLAHNGLLFLDELPEFKRKALEVLRQPMEEGVVSLSRAGFRVRYPAGFMLVAAMNPCPCGYLGDPIKACSCTRVQIQRYNAIISGPLLDRIDLHIEVPAVPYKELSGRALPESSSRIRQRVEAAREIQTKRFCGTPVFGNAAMGAGLSREYCKLDSDSAMLLERAVDSLGFSARAYGRVLKIARTIADLAGEEQIGKSHVAEAIQYRSMDRTAVF